MEIQEDKIQQRLQKLRQKQTPQKKQSDKALEIDTDTKISAYTVQKPAYTFSQELQCTPSSKKYVTSCRKLPQGRYILNRNQTPLSTMASSLKPSHSRNTFNKSALLKNEGLSLMPLRDKYQSSHLPVTPHVPMSDSFNSTNIQLDLDQSRSLQEQLEAMQNKLKKSKQQQISQRRASSAAEKAELEKIQKHLHELELYTASEQKRRQDIYHVEGEVCIERVIKIRERSRMRQQSKQNQACQSRLQTPGLRSPGVKSISSVNKLTGPVGHLQQMHNDNLRMLKRVQKEQGEALQGSRARTLNNVLRKNKQLVDSVPESIADESVKKEFLKQRKNLMVRLIHSELRNKKISEWTMKSLNRIQRDQILEQSQRPPSVVNYLEKKRREAMNTRPKGLEETK